MAGTFCKRMFARMHGKPPLQNKSKQSLRVEEQMKNDLLLRIFYVSFNQEKLEILCN